MKERAGRESDKDTWDTIHSAEQDALLWSWALPALAEIERSQKGAVPDLVDVALGHLDRIDFTIFEGVIKYARNLTPAG